MDVVDWILIIGAISALPLYGLVSWACGKIRERVVDRRYEVEELREKLKAAEDERDRWKETAKSTDKLLRAAVERADRLAAMGHGLAEDLAALKAYDPDEIEERLKKIREIRAEEERKESVAKLNQAIQLQVAYSMLHGGYGFTPNAYCSLADQRWTMGRW